MNKVNFKTYKFRCSALPYLMTTSRSKTDPLSDTTKAYLREVWIAEVFGRIKYDLKNKFTDKGIACESDSLDLVQKVTKTTYFKNKKLLENEWIKGTPDVIKKDSIIDIKTSWDIWTYAKVDADLAQKTYFYQLLGYMWLTGTKNSELMYCLVNTPEEIISDELYKLAFRYPEINESTEAAEKYRFNYIFDDIDPKLRLKTFALPYIEDEVKLLKEKIVASREYLGKLKL